MPVSYNVVVVGCKKHDLIAQKYFELIKKYWNESLNKTIFCTDYASEIFDLFNVPVVANENDNFAERILTAINGLASEYVILFLDDYFITKKIDVTEIEDLLLSIKNNSINYCKLVGQPKSFKRYKKIKSTFCIKEKLHYGVSLQPSIWKRTELIKALKKCTKTTPAGTEAGLSIYQKNEFKNCITFNKNLLSYKNGIIRGRLFPYTNKILEENNIEPLKLDVITKKEYFVFCFKQYFLLNLPNFLRKIYKNIKKKQGKSYNLDD